MSQWIESIYWVTKYIRWLISMNYVKALPFKKAKPKNQHGKPKEKSILTLNSTSYSMY